MDRNWTNVGALLKAQREHLRMTQKDLADAANLSIAIVQMLEAGRKDSYRGTTLAAISAALRWPTDAIERLLAGEDPETFDDTPALEIVENESPDLDDISARLAVVEEGVAQLLSLTGELLRRQQEVNGSP